MMPVVDFHCDLLLYLSGAPERTALDPICRCSLPQLEKGGVKLQILPMFEAGFGNKQAELFANLPKHYPERVEIIQRAEQLERFPERKKIGILLAIENASTWCDEEENLPKRLQALEQIPKPVYISLTWNFENRFGGGSLTTAGLKEDGKRVLDFMHGKKIAIDLSHASDALAGDIFRYIDTQKLAIPVIASHSNSREVCDVPRNLPDEFIREIFQRNGIIGLNVIRGFVGETPEKFASHVDRLLTLGGEGRICLGMDFFYENDLAACFRKTADQLFYPGFTDASCYPKLFSLCPPSIIEGISHKNALSFLKRSIVVP